MRKFFSIVFLLFFILFFPLSLLSFNLKISILAPTFFKESFRKINFYSRIVKIDPQKVADYIGGKSGEAGAVSAKQISTVLGYISPGDLQSTFEKNIDSYLSSIAKGESNFAIDLTAIKKSVQSKQIDAQTIELVRKIPDVYTPPQTNQTAKKFSSFLSIGKILSYASFIFVILCLALSFVLWPTWRGRLRFIGTVLLTFGLSTLIIEIILQRIPIPQGIIADFLDGILHDLILVAKAKFLFLYFVEAIGMISVGFVFWLISFFMKSNPVSLPQPITKQ